MLEREVLGNPTVGKSHAYSLSAWTGFAASEQQVGNIVLEVIEGDDCRPPLTDSELAEELVNACGAETDDCNQECYLGTMQPLVANGKISDAQMFVQLSACSDLACQPEAVEPVDVETIRRQAFADGAASVNLSVACEPIRRQGFTDGIASVNVEQIRKEAYAAGFKEGQKEGQKVTICHKENKKVNGVSKVEQSTLTVSINALSAHLAHGDTIGACKTTSGLLQKF